VSSPTDQVKQDQIRCAIHRIEEKRELIGRLLSEIDNEYDVIDQILDSFITPPF